MQGAGDQWDGGTLTGRVNGSEMRVGVIGGDWQRHDIAEALRHMTALPKKTRDGTGELSLPLTWAVVTQCARLAEQREFRWRPDGGLSSWIAGEFTRRFSEYKGPGDLRLSLASTARVPMVHQLAGAYLGATNRRLFFADSAGTGKSMTALLTLAELDARGLDPFPAFIVAPASVVDPWMEEIEEVFPGWTRATYRGPSRKRLSSRFQVYVMSWDTMRADMQQPKVGECGCGAVITWTRALQKALDQHVMAPGSFEPARCAECRSVFRPSEDKGRLPPLVDFAVPRTIVLDEAHGMCNTNTKQSVAARRLARVAEFAFPMSGTPITRDVGGFWSALNVLDTRSFPDQERYKERYTDRHRQDYGNDKVEGLTSVNREEFYTLMQGSMRRVAKADVLTELPDKTYSTRVVQLPPAYRKAYNEMAEDMIAHLPDTDEPLPVMSTLAQMQRLSQLASSACDVEVTHVLDEREGSPTYGEEVPHYKVTMREPSWKVDELMQVLEESDGEPIVTFSPHTQLMNLAGARAEKAGYRVGYIKGGQSAGLRTRTRLAFQAGELDLLCVNVAAGGTGLTLTAAHTAVFLERPWAYWQADQAEDRIHRRGQEGQVTIIDVVAESTIESRVREALKGKAEQLSTLIRDRRVVESFLSGQKVRV